MQESRGLLDSAEVCGWILENWVIRSGPAYELHCMDAGYAR